jgi:oligoendopeptidase F
MKEPDMETDKAQPHKRRADIPEKYRWKLEDIYKTDGDWEQAFSAVPALLESLRKWRGRIAESSGSLLAALEESGNLDMELMELLAYARMRRDEDNAAADYQNMADRAIGLYYQASAVTAFLTPEIAAIPEETLKAWLDSEPGLAPYRHSLDNITRTRPHILPEAQEALLSSFGPVAEGIGDVFTMLDNVDIKLGSVEDSQGNRIELTHAAFALLREHRDRKVRADAFKSVHDAYSAVGRSISVLYGTQVKADLLVASARQYPDSLNAALFSDNLPDSLYAGLIGAVHDGIPGLGVYLEVRRKCLDLDELHFYDAYVPMIAQPEKHYTFEEACDLLRKGLAPLGGQYLEDLEKHLDSRWIDVFETPGKTSGAYSWGSYRSHPYILLNFNGSLSDVFTLAHEIGHSMHTYYSNKRPFSESHYPIFLAEIASTVNENLLMQHLLNRCDTATETGRQEKAFLLNHFLEEFRLTVFRQTLFAEFEWLAHKQAENGGALTADWLCDLYGRLLDQYYGPRIITDDYMRWEWTRIPHFYNAYYVYKYATGFSAAIALSRQIMSGGTDAARRYLAFLGAGGSDYPLRTMAEAGIDLADRQPVDDAMAEFSARLDQLVRLIDGRQASWKPN